MENGYNAEILEEIRSLKSEIASLKKAMGEKEPEQPKVRWMKEKDVEAKITTLLLELHISAKIKGFSALREAVKTTYYNPELLVNMSQHLYWELAAKYKTTPGAVERSIRYALEISWKKSKLHPIYCGSMDKPTNARFIALITDTLIQNSAAADREE